MEFNTPLITVQGDEQRGTEPRLLPRFAIIILGLIYTGLFAAVILLSRSPASEFQVSDLPEQRQHAPSKESQMLVSSVNRATSVYMFNNLMKTNFVSDVEMVENMIADMQLKMLFDDFLATIGSQAPLASGQMRTKSNKYLTAAEHNHRFDIFRKNLLNIMQLNAKEYARNPDINRARFAITVHADWTEHEFRTTRLNMKVTNFTAISEKYGLGKSKGEKVENVSAIECSRVTTAPVRDQGICGSCWAFSATEQLRYSFFHKYKRDIGKLSVQYLLDCMPAEAPYCFLGPFLAVDSGCCGGLPIDADKWIESNGGIPTVDEYGPYLNGKSPEDHFDCRTNVTKALTPVGGVKFLHSETEIANGYCNTGSVSIGIVANDQWMFYAGGMMDAVSCPAGDYANHAVLVTGIDRFYFDTPAYVVQNSWGKDWGVPSTRPYKNAGDGDNGFMLFRFGNNTCGIKTMAMVPSDIQPALS
mmetsp:Transcript_159658/g.294339  ORF Transcript_159658/g.294339 Transcript_159658/m.294339 type:complete len:473 (+) Transcript_159658:83-1501(+)